MKYLNELEIVLNQRNSFYRKPVAERKIDEVEAFRKDYNRAWSNVIDAATIGILEIKELEAIQSKIGDEKYVLSEFNTDYTDILNLCLANSETGFSKLKELLHTIWSDGVITTEERKQVEDFVQKTELNYAKAGLIIREFRDKYATKDLKSIVAGYGREVFGWNEMKLMQRISSDYNINPISLNLNELRESISDFKSAFQSQSEYENNDEVQTDSSVVHDQNMKYEAYGWKWIEISRLNDDVENFLDFSSQRKEIYYAPRLHEVIPDELSFIRITFTVVISPYLEGKKLLRKMLGFSDFM